MHVPETPMHLDNFLSADQDDIGLSGKIFSMQAVTETHPVHNGADD
jgi:hypothetical protein